MKTTRQETIVFRRSPDLEIRYRIGPELLGKHGVMWEAIAYRVMGGRWRRCRADSARSRRLLGGWTWLSDMEITCHSCGAMLRVTDDGFGTPCGICQSCVRSPVS